ncbi:MAG: hypothetical protein E4H42_04970 [Chromatiales bacterium]|nr:MAG: hypothetical protein E4H42_04970 [Chromatiales bacterium]
MSNFQFQRLDLTITFLDEARFARGNIAQGFDFNIELISLRLANADLGFQPKPFCVQLLNVALKLVDRFFCVIVDRTLVPKL